MLEHRLFVKQTNNTNKDCLAWPGTFAFVCAFYDPNMCILTKILCPIQWDEINQNTS